MPQELEIIGVAHNHENMLPDPETLPVDTIGKCSCGQLFNVSIQMLRWGFVDIPKVEFTPPKKRFYQSAAKHEANVRAARARWERDWSHVWHPYEGKVDDIVRPGTGDEGERGPS